MTFKTPPGESPLGIVQEKLERGQYHGWRVLVACICMDRVRGVKAEPVVEKVLKRWPKPTDLGGASGELEDVLRPLGLGAKRAKTLRAMSTAWEEGEWADPGDLPGVGAYALSAWGIFVDRVLPEEEPADGWLAAYWRWAVAVSTPKIGNGSNRLHRRDGKRKRSRRGPPEDVIVGDAILTIGQACYVLGIAYEKVKEECRIGNLAGRFLGRGQGWITTLSACRAWAEGKNAGNKAVPKRVTKFSRAPAGHFEPMSAPTDDE